jgi:hypothetical protein
MGKRLPDLELLRVSRLMPKLQYLVLDYEGVRAGDLSATVIVRPSSGTAIALMTRSFQTKVQPAEHAFTLPEPFPRLEALKPILSRL